MPTNLLIRKNGADILKKMLPQAFAITGIAALAYLFVVVISEIFSLVFQQFIFIELFIDILVFVLMFFFCSPLMLGILRFFWRLTAGADDSLSSCFFYFSNAKNYKKSLSLSLQQFFRIYFIQIVLLIPSYLEKQFSFENLFPKNPLTSGYQAIFTDTFELIGIIGAYLALWFGIRYFLAPFLLFNDDSLTAGEAMKRSNQIMKHRVVKTIGFALGYFGWIMLSVLIILPLPYVFPYMMLGMTIYARYIIVDYNFNILKGGINHHGWTYNQ